MQKKLFSLYLHYINFLLFTKSKKDHFIFASIKVQMLELSYFARSKNIFVI